MNHSNLSKIPLLYSSPVFAGNTEEILYTKFMLQNGSLFDVRVRNKKPADALLLIVRHLRSGAKFERKIAILMSRAGTLLKNVV